MRPPSAVRRGNSGTVTKSGEKLVILLPVEHRASPNFDDRPDGVVVDTIVLHATVLNTLDAVAAHFENPDTKVSAHYTIDRDGTVACHVAEEKRAWHAGQSKMKDGRTGVNDFSIGIELVNL